MQFFREVDYIIEIKFSPKKAIEVEFSQKLILLLAASFFGLLSLTFFFNSSTDKAKVTASILPANIETTVEKPVEKPIEKPIEKAIGASSLIKITDREIVKGDSNVFLKFSLTKFSPSSKRLRGKVISYLETASGQRIYPDGKAGFNQKFETFSFRTLRPTKLSFRTEGVELYEAKIVLMIKTQESVIERSIEL